MDFGKISNPELAVIDNVVAGTVADNKAVVPTTSKQIDELNITNSEITNLEATNLEATNLDVTVLTLPTGTPVNAVASTGTLTINGVVIDGETVTIGTDVYEFDADDSVDGDNIAVDISGGTKVQATGTLTFEGVVSDGELVVIGDDTYEFDTAGEATITEGNIRVDVSGGVSAAQAVTALVTAVTNSDTVGVGAVDGDSDTVVFTADAAGAVDGSAGNSVITTTTCVHAGFANAKLTGGSDATAAEAVTALVAAITADDTVGVGAVDGAEDTVDLTADIKGVIGDSIATTEDMANGEFGAEFLAGGLDGTIVASKGFHFADSRYIYFSTAANTTADTNWRRVDLGASGY